MKVGVLRKQLGSAQSQSRKGRLIPGARLSHREALQTHVPESQSIPEEGTMRLKGASWGGAFRNEGVLCGHCYFVTFPTLFFLSYLFLI